MYMYSHMCAYVDMYIYIYIYIYMCWDVQVRSSRNSLKSSALVFPPMIKAK